ncbi:DUF1080 domain-containing protein [Algibacter amylolyticus]|uniref:DUF1080 domain-containing protein n=1 Tax=Algibacter amylolyticus TaxID=1608400 RepID=A0A5M7B7A6_9FLAO|nr:DUF1080 domain-containing protein [Algibacter amylolyticus]KAA5825202.1 DUF1080 domain-containing protein [Algibacter amylolyticus]MBB5268677.1 hypothetical protein [Algibacter amylolyticus]TSJ77696.1 DUF1080 domain-containing protein [Algibacter amylolyticus]
MKFYLKICLLILVISFNNFVFSQISLKSLNEFKPSNGEWVEAETIQLDSLNTQKFSFSSGEGIFVNGENGKAKYLVSKKEYQDVEIHLEFMLPKGSNSGIYIQSRYEIQLFDSWGVTGLTFYDCGGIQQRWDQTKPEAERGYGGFAPRTNASKAPGEWQELDVIFKAAKFNDLGEKVKNARFDKVILNGVVIHENIELSGPTKGALSETEIASAPFRLQGGHGPVAFKNIRVRDLNHIRSSKPNKWIDLFENTNEAGPNYDFIVHGNATKEEANAMFEFTGKKLKAMYKWPKTAAPYGIAVTKKAYKDYDLKFEFKWGERRFEPRLEKIRDAGLLYHCPIGTYAWPPSLEYQIQEGDCGDLWNIMGAHCDVLKNGEIIKIKRRDYSSSKKWSDEEKPGWNKVLLKVRGNSAKYYLNGVLINEIKNATYGGLSLTSGFIALQAEYAEVIYRKIKIKEL